MITYKCKYKNSILLQKHIFKNHKISWNTGTMLLDLNENRKKFNNSLINKNDNVLFFIESDLTYVKYDGRNYVNEYNDAIDFENILRENKLKRIIEDGE